MMGDWNSYNGGRRWRMLGEYIMVKEPDSLNFIESRDHGDDGYLYRTKGEPMSARTALADYGAAMRQAQDHFGIPLRLLFAMMAIEATRNPRDRSHFNPRSVREEPGYVSDDKTPHRVSPGLMQTLISTAREAAERAGLYPGERLTREDLFIAERSIMVGAAYMRYQIDRVEPDEKGFAPDDPILLCSAYNAGSVRETDKNPFRLLTYGGTSRIEKFIAYHNDMVAVLDA